MADVKITSLAVLTAADPINDAIPIVDVSDVTMAASGTTKRISVNNILGASGTATLASATITGDLTVKTNVLKVDTTNNRVGIGTATPVRPVDIVGSFQSSAGWALVGSPAGLGGTTRYIGGAGGTDSWYFNALTGGNHLWAFGEVEAMRLNSTGLGVGGSPGSRLDVRFPTNPVVDNAGGSHALRAWTTATQATDVGGQLGLGGLYDATNSQSFATVSGKKENATSGNNAGYFSVGTCGSSGTMVERMRIDSAGNPIFSPSATPATLTVNGQLTVNATSNTNLRFSYRGSDGTTRVANITLA